MILKKKKPKIDKKLSEISSSFMDSIIAGNISADSIYTTGAGNITWDITWDSWPNPLPPYSCPKHGEIGEEVVRVTDPDGKEHYYCKKCAEEILSKATEEAIRWEDELTKRDFSDQ